MLRTFRKRRGQKGFTLIELLIVVAIIGIIAALLIPNFLDALNKARQKRTQGDMRNVGTAMMAWLTDNLGAAAAGQETVDWADWTGTGSLATIRSELVPGYIQEVPDRDAWKHSFQFKMSIADPAVERFAAVRSPGRNTSFDATYTVGGFDPTDYDQDIVWGDGTFIRFPQKQN